jgi:hypothetical protein
MALWHRLGAVPPEVASDRVKELCAVAYGDGALAGVTTVVLGQMPQLGCRFAFFRCLVAPEYREQEIARKLTVYSRDLLAEWSSNHPDERVLGMAAIVQSPQLDALSRLPVWPASKLTLMGYTESGLQIRIVWFDHARLTPRGPSAPSRLAENDNAELITVWRQDNPAIVAKATALWKELGVLPQGTSAAERAAQLFGAALVNGELAGVSTVVLDELPQLRARFGFFRCLVAPSYRRRYLARKLGVHALHTLSSWSKENPDEKILGMVTIIESSSLEETSKIPAWSEPGVENDLILIGYTPAGWQIRVSWFPHARL